MSRRIQVAARLRPGDGGLSCVSFDGESGSDIVVSDVAGTNANSIPRSFHVDQVIPEDCDNAQLFRNLVLGRVLSSVKEPDTSCFLAYGHTNSGKTHTIAGTPKEPGLLTLSASSVLDAYGMAEVAMLEVYGETVHDLLAEGERRRIRRRSGPEGTVIVVEELTTCVVKSMEEWEAVSAFGMQTRRTAPTERNPRSSRSHAIFTIKSHGLRLCLVDLAGSERQTTYSPQLNKESIAINKSLSRLSTVLEALSTTRQKADGTSSYVNFRDTALTVLLQRYLSGSSMTVFLACIHPDAEFYHETMSTMRYTQRLRRINTKNAPRRTNEDTSLFHFEEKKSLLVELLHLRKIVGERQDKQRGPDCRSGFGSIPGVQVDGDAQTASSAQTRGSSSVERHAKADLIETQRRQRLMRSNETKRVAGWLLSRVLRELPELSVGFDDYFDAYLPPQVQVVGYISLMACLAPRDPSEASGSLAFLDVGDIAMGLSMLDAGIPACVGLHRIGCAEFSTWEAHEYDEMNRVFVLAFFEVNEHLVEMIDASDDTFGCCRGFLTLEPLVPLAVVLCTPHDASDELKEGILHHLVTLHGEQESVLEKVTSGGGGGGGDGSSSTSSPGGENPSSTSSTERSKIDVLREMTLWCHGDVARDGLCNDSIKSPLAMTAPPPPPSAPTRTPPPPPPPTRTPPPPPPPPPSSSTKEVRECARKHVQLLAPRFESSSSSSSSSSKSQKPEFNEPSKLPVCHPRDFAVHSSSSSVREMVDVPLEPSCAPPRKVTEVAPLENSQIGSSVKFESGSESSAEMDTPESINADDVVVTNTAVSHMQVHLSITRADTLMTGPQLTLHPSQDSKDVCTAVDTSPSSTHSPRYPPSPPTPPQEESGGHLRKSRAGRIVASSRPLRDPNSTGDKKNEEAHSKKAHRKRRMPVLHGCHGCAML